jgi:hypothetical protein
VVKSWEGAAVVPGRGNHCMTAGAVIDETSELAYLSMRHAGYGYLASTVQHHGMPNIIAERSRKPGLGTYDPENACSLWESNFISNGACDDPYMKSRCCLS